MTNARQRALDEAIQKRLDEILADWPEDTPEQVSAAARILANANRRDVAPYVPIARPKPSPRCALYWHYDADDVLLYVGVSNGPVARGKNHADRSPWVVFASRIEAQWFDTRTLAEAAEIAAIREHKPVFNKKHADAARNDRAVRYLVGHDRLDLLTSAI